MFMGETTALEISHAYLQKLFPVKINIISTNRYYAWKLTDSQKVFIIFLLFPMEEEYLPSHNQGKFNFFLFYFIFQLKK